MNNLATANTVRKVAFREKIEYIQDTLKDWQEEGLWDSTLDDCELTHYFSPVVEEFGCAVYGRQMFIPKDTLIVGKIHKHSHLNVILKGKILVTTEFGKEYFEAPHVFVSDVGTKRAVRSVEDTLWLTVHLTRHDSEEHVDEIVDDLTVKEYQELGLVNTLDNLKLLTGEQS
jgi:quercetin dioxygenase-like cupin family protein